MNIGDTIIQDGKRLTIVGSRFSPLKRKTILIGVDRDGQRFDIKPEAKNTLADAIVTIKGKDGYTPQKGTDYFTKEEINKIVDSVYGMIEIPKDGKDGKTGATGPIGPDGKDGRDGKDGKTPVAGKDYPTKAQVMEWVLLEVEKIKVPEGKPGKDGKTPEHKWDGTKLFWKNPDGKWDKGVDLKGPMADFAQSFATHGPNDVWKNGDKTVINSLTVSSVAPSNPKINDLWVDIS